MDAGETAGEAPPRERRYVYNGASIARVCTSSPLAQPTAGPRVSRVILAWMDGRYVFSERLPDRAPMLVLARLFMVFMVSSST